MYTLIPVPNFTFLFQITRYGHETQYLTSGNRLLLERILSCQLVKKRPAFSETRRFITVYKKSRYFSVAWARSILPAIPIPFLEHYFNIIFQSTRTSSKLSLSLRFPNQFPACTSLLPHTCRTTSPFHSSWSDHNTNKYPMRGTDHEAPNSATSPSPPTPRPSGPNIFLSTLLSNTPRLLSSLTVMDQVSHPHKTTGVIIVLFILIFTS